MGSPARAAHPISVHAYPAAPAPARRAIDTARALFPALGDTGEVYLDSAATTQKPWPVIDAVTGYHRAHTANAGRGAYRWSTELAGRIAEVRARMATFIGAAHTDEIVFTGGATAALNAVALSWGLATLADGDQILFNPHDHAANVLPWFHLREIMARFGRRIELVPYRVTELGEADIADIASKIGPRTRLITTSHLHHVYGAVTTLEELRGRIPARVLLCFDCSQSGGHLPVDVTELGADFAVFAAHKMFGAPGAGVLYCHRRVHDQLIPFLPGGGAGVRTAGGARTPMPGLLEGGTPDIPALLALGAALEVLESFGLSAIAEHNRDLTLRLLDGLRAIPAVRFLPGPAHASCATGYGIVSFTLDGISADDLGFVLAESGFMVRTGSHCVPGDPAMSPDIDSVRVSTQIYNTHTEIDRFTDCVRQVAEEVL
ncbi:aminotransferase class V-fold PLP-dependent enzyme [Nocardia cyriacigeorgica]|uniref:aminotransferase class V-fold PLP-dependent enzyme n=1 Tax=Nocardia cyriacigeorgica TaxID=135487 RepID=UPI0024578DB0|nr:aminotransferase class V-fold PLP-dependent enzyme [Nocardia cyriacigeorgica]